MPENCKLYEAIPDEIIIVNITAQDEVWQIFFDGVARIRLNGRVITRTGIVFISPENNVLSYSYLLIDPCPNNVAEYNVLITEFQIAKRMWVKYFEVYVDSKLVINQVKGEYYVRNEDLMPYCQSTILLAGRF